MQSAAKPIFLWLRTSKPSTIMFGQFRANVHASAINQQIALKTIQKLGLSANAVWNGQEALDYLAKDFTPEHKKPDIILMDVQMPILDG